MKVINRYNRLLFLFAWLIGLFVSCQKMERPAMNIIPDDLERLNGPLQLYFPFDGNLIDSAQYQKATASGTINYVAGVNKEAYKGTLDSYIKIPLTQKMAELTSFTIAFWMNANKAAANAESVFTISNSGDFWGNIFALIEPNTNDADPTMLLKFNFAGNWIEFNGNNGLDRLQDMYGKWKHLAFSYDETTSEVSVYIDGVKLNLPENVAKRVKDGNPLGPLKLENSAQVIIGGFQQHAGISGNADSWMEKYSGLLDQFRMYDKAMGRDEILKLFNEKK
jgi:hypothetical protein